MDRHRSDDANTDAGRRVRLRSRWVVVGLGGLAAAIGAVALLGGPRSSIEATPAQVDDHDGHDHHDHASALSADGRFTGPGEVWPPEVRDATDVVALDFSDQEAVTDERAVAPGPAARMLAAESGTDLEVALADRRVRSALGDRYTLVSVTEDEIVPGSVKGAPASEATLALFYSHSAHATVEIYLDRGRVVSVERRPAREQQPPLAVDEKYRAAELARAHWEAAGDDRIDQLEGFVILAVQPGGAYYASRVAYVSFHLDNVARPELLTWVDLTGDSVIRAEVDR